MSDDNRHKEELKSGTVDDGGEQPTTAAARSTMPLAIVALSGLLVVLLLFSAGTLAIGRGRVHKGPPTPLAKSFMDFPVDFFPGYTWRQGVLEPEIERLVGSNATLKLTGVGRQGWVDLYTSYFGYASTPLEHEPDVCYPAQGWDLPLGVIRTEINLPGRSEPLPINVFYFTKELQRVLVVNYYCINGEYYNDRLETKFLETGEGGYYAQTRVTVEVKGEELTRETYRDHEAFKRARDVMVVAAPLIETYLPQMGGSNDDKTQADQ